MTPPHGIPLDDSDPNLPARKLRRWTLVAAVLRGMTLATQALIAVAGKAVLRETVRQAVREEMGRPAVATAPSHWINQAQAAPKGQTP